MLGLKRYTTKHFVKEPIAVRLRTKLIKFVTYIYLICIAFKNNLYNVQLSNFNVLCSIYSHKQLCKFRLLPKSSALTEIAGLEICRGEPLGVFVSLLTLLQTKIIALKLSASNALQHRTFLFP